MKKVLYIEDNLDVSESLKMLFDEHPESQYRFTTVPSLQKGLDILFKERFDLILFDIKTDNEKGNDLELQSDLDDFICEKSIPLIVYTGLNRSIESKLDIKHWNGWINKITSTPEINFNRIKLAMDRALGL